MLAAVRHSYLLGLGGRVWLSSLPSERTRDFYTNRGFEVTFPKGRMVGSNLSYQPQRQWRGSKRKGICDGSQRRQFCASNRRSRTRARIRSAATSTVYAT